ncbi:MAG TPA: hypothetical protein VHW23_25430 [Kofleriaceae bacterium]|nr:hypothetical protein [Kofleriaceae bacterium]
MDGIKRFLTVACLAGCSGGGGGGGAGGQGDAGMNPGSDAPGDTGSNLGGDALQVSGNDHCDGAFTINLATMHSDLTTNPAGATADLAAPCGTAGTPDVFFKFTLTRREMVYADTFGASGTTALFFATSCSAARTASTTPGDAVCSTGACGTGQSQVVALLDPGTHYLVLAAQAAATIHFQHVEVGSGTVAYLPPGSSAPTGTTMNGPGTLYACDAGGSENAYWWQTCPSDTGGTFVASTCTGTNFDTILSLQMPGSENVFCDDDTCSVQSTVSANIPGGAGLNVIAVDGFSQSRYGNYTLTVSRP